MGLSTTAKSEEEEFTEIQSASQKQEEQARMSNST